MVRRSPLTSVVFAFFMWGCARESHFAGGYRFDIDGNVIDAHDGGPRVFNSTYYLYGTSYDCGFEWYSGGAFCGFRAYSSPDLVNFSNRGLLFDPRPWQDICVGNLIGCFRPHVVSNPNTGQYVLWINSYEHGGDYHVFESSTPDSGFVEVGVASLAVNRTGTGIRNGDENLFVDADGTGYVIYTDVPSGYDQIVERLTPDFHNGTGEYVRLNLKNTEAGSLFRRKNKYYVIVSDPNCAYCSGTGATYLSADAPLGTWSAPRKFSNDSCGGQPSAVMSLPDESRFVFQSDLWTGERNEALANVFWGNLEFDDAGHITELNCAKPLDVPSLGGPIAATKPIDLDQASDEADDFFAVIDIGTAAGAVARAQPFTASRTGTLTSIGFSAFQHGHPDGPLHLSIYRVRDGSSQADELLFEADQSATSVGWSPKILVWPLSVAVAKGQQYVFQLQAHLTQGSFGTLIGKGRPYPLSGRVSQDGGRSWAIDEGRALKFFTTVGEPR